MKASHIMWIFLVSFLLLLSPGHGSHRHCINPNVPVTKIVGGKVTNVGWPWMASLRQIGGNIGCAGTVLNEWYILTAAHCMYSHGAQPGDPPRPTTDFDIGVGSNDLLSQDSYAIEQMIPHEKFRPGKSFYYDIALVKVSTPIKLSEKIQKVCLISCSISTNEVEKNGTAATIVGWGETREQGGTAYSLNEATIKIVPRDQCNLDLGVGEGEDPVIENGVVDSQFCLVQDGVDTCQGDSGGPVFFNHNGHWHQFGIVSFGYGCARPNEPGIYTKVSHFLQWAYSKAGIKKCNQTADSQGKGERTY